MLIVALLACDPGRRAFDNLPDDPPHTDREEGYFHASGKSRPYLCRDETGAQVTCPTDGFRPEPRQLSCDAVGCHGGNDFTGALTDDERHLLGSDGPTCFTCHGREWSNTMVAE